MRSLGIAPTSVSGLSDSTADRLEFIAGSRLLGLFGRRWELAPQQLLLADVLNAGHRDNSVLLPRRSSKSTSLIAWALGRAASEGREDYRIGLLTLTAGKAGRSRFMKDVVPQLDRNHDGRLKTFRAAGQERVEWRDTGNTVSWLSSLDDIRGEAFDVLIGDEAGEADPDKGADFISAALPTMDTRPGAQLVLAGTAGDYRQGNVLWDGLQVGLAGRAGILAYYAPDGLTQAELAAWEPSIEHPEARVRELVERYHPGVNTLTTLDAIRTNYERMPIDKFIREYLSVFADTATSAAVFDLVAWERAAVVGRPVQPPAGAVLGIAVHPEQTTAAIVAAWRDEDGLAHVGVVEHRRGTSWLARRAAEVAIKHNLEIVHDSKGPVMVAAEELARLRPKPRMNQATFGNVTTAAALIVREVATGQARHYNAPEMNDAVRLARKRHVGPTAWALGRADPHDDIITIEAAALALRRADEAPKRQSLKPSFG